MLFCVPNVVYCYGRQISIAKFFFVGSISRKRKLNFHDFLWVAIFEIFKVCTKLARLERSSFVPITKPLINKRGETFCGQKDFEKKLSFSRNPPNILLKKLYGETHINPVNYHFRNWEILGFLLRVITIYRHFALQIVTRFIFKHIYDTIEASYYKNR